VIKCIYCNCLTTSPNAVCSRCNGDATPLADLHLLPHHGELVISLISVSQAPSVTLTTYQVSELYQMLGSFLEESTK